MLVDGSETDDSNGAEVDGIGGDRLGPRSEIPKWSADVYVIGGSLLSSSYCDQILSPLTIRTLVPPPHQHVAFCQNQLEP